MRYVVAYDIADDRRRTKIADLLGIWGRRVQYSVFECELTGREFGTLLADIERLTVASADRARVYRLCRACAAEAISLGRSTISLDPTAWIL